MDRRAQIRMSLAYPDCELIVRAILQTELVPDGPAPRLRWQHQIEVSGYCWVVSRLTAAKNTFEVEGIQGEEGIFKRLPPQGNARHQTEPLSANKMNRRLILDDKPVKEHRRCLKHPMQIPARERASFGSLSPTNYGRFPRKVAQLVRLCDKLNALGGRLAGRKLLRERTIRLNELRWNRDQSPRRQRMQDNRSHLP